MIEIDPEQRLDRREAAAFLTRLGYRTAVATLAKLATIGGGPKYERFGRRPVYRVADLKAWINDRTSAPTHSTSNYN